MKIIVVSATQFEIQPLLSEMDDVFDAGRNMLSCKYKKHSIDFLITGVGMAATAFHCGRVLNNGYNVAFNIGICGSFNKNLEIGMVVNIFEDHFVELGAEDGNDFLSLQELKLEGTTVIKNSKSQILNSKLEELPKVNGITVSTSHGNEKSIAKVFDRFHPMVESMEGAAFMLACDFEKIPYAQIRAVSNFVEKRNRDAWNISLAIKNLNKKILEIINGI